MRIGVLAYTFYESDNRVMRYAETLSARGDRVDVFALRRKGQPQYEKIGNINLYRIQERELNEKSQLNYFVRLIKFLMRSSYFVTKMHLKDPYDLIHVHSVPDFEVFAAFLPKIMGARLILDIHDLVPEFYLNKFPNETLLNRVFYNLLLLAEKVSIRFADHVIISNHIWKERILERSVIPEKCTVILNYPDTTIFRRVHKKKQNNNFVILYPGTINEHQGLDLAVKAFSKVAENIPNAYFYIYGDGPSRHAIERLVNELKLNDRVVLRKPISIKKIAKIMAQADLGIIPKRNDGFGGEAFSTKSLEFMSLGIPIVISRTKIDNYYFNDSVVRFFEPGNVDDLAKAILEMLENEEMRSQLAKRASQFVKRYLWESNKHIYLDLVDRLVAKN